MPRSAADMYNESKVADMKAQQRWDEANKPDENHVQLNNMSRVRDKYTNDIKFIGRELVMLPVGNPNYKSPISPEDNAPIRAEVTVRIKEDTPASDVIICDDGNPSNKKGRYSLNVSKDYELEIHPYKIELNDEGKPYRNADGSLKYEINENKLPVTDYSKDHQFIVPAGIFKDVNDKAQQIVEAGKAAYAAEHPYKKTENKSKQESHTYDRSAFIIDNNSGSQKDDGNPGLGG